MEMTTDDRHSDTCWYDPQPGRWYCALDCPVVGSGRRLEAHAIVEQPRTVTDRMSDEPPPDRREP